jgi:hypothetical protein
MVDVVAVKISFYTKLRSVKEPFRTGWDLRGASAPFHEKANFKPTWRRTKRNVSSP